MNETTFDDLRNVVVYPHAGALKEAFVAFQLFEAKLCEAVGEFDHARLWDVEGARSMADWLTVACGFSRRNAKRWSSTAAQLLVLPVTAAAWRDGSLSSGQVEAIVGHVNDETRPRFAEMETAIVPTIVGLSVADTRVVMRTWAAHAQAVVDHDKKTKGFDAVSHAHFSFLLNGTARLDADLNDHDAAIIHEALRLARRDDCPGEFRDNAMSTADALVDICQWYMSERDHKPSTGRNRPHVNIVIPIEGLGTRTGAHTQTGQPIRPETLATWLCDANLHPAVINTDGVVLDYGRAVRSATTEQFNALVIRDGGCRWPGCDNPPHRCDAHHLQDWDHDGPTDLNNLALLCRRHHRIGHRKNWRVHLEPDNTLIVTHPHGHTYTSPSPHSLRTQTTAA